MALKLEVFEPSHKDRPGKTVVMDAIILEETKLASYETGYSAGWEDAISAQSSDQSQAKAEVARGLQALGFTYHEARSHILKALKPLLSEIVNRLLPAIARETLGPMVLDAVMPLADALTEAPLELRLSPSVRNIVEVFLENEINIPIVIVEEPSLSEGQVYLKLGSNEIQINLDRVIDEIRVATNTFFEVSRKESTIG